MNSRSMADAQVAAGGALDYPELAEGGYACAAGEPQLKYAAKQGTTKAQLSKPRMQSPISKKYSSSSMKLSKVRALMLL